MASNRKIWKTRKVAQIIFLAFLLSILLFVVYDKKKEKNSVPTQYILNDKISASFEYHIKTENAAPSPDAVPYIKIDGINDLDEKVSFKAKANEMTVSAFPGSRIVHLDLKGAPPKINYYADFFPFLKKLGATGILLEYEDMFPYSAVDVAAGNAYTLSDIKKIINYARDSSLEVIPLIQTFGHMEFVLKLEKYKHLRENFKYPQAICPSKNESLQVLYSMIDEILEAHQGMKYFHIGCDEVYQIAQCNDCRERIHQNKWSNKELFLSHITTLARYITKKSQGNVKPLIWDDELRTMSVAQLQMWDVGKLIEPVIWKYTADVEAHLTEDLWLKYSQVFSAVWFASAFKGARYPNAFTSYINFYFENHKSWMGLIYKYSDKIYFRGGIITGWQRYDHFAVLCELLPVAVPSLALNLMYLSTDIKWAKKSFNGEAYDRVVFTFFSHFKPNGYLWLVVLLIALVELSVKTQRVCGCDANPVMATTPHGSCTFPGACLYMAVTRLPQLIFALQREKDYSYYKGWMTAYNIKYSFSNPSHVEVATNNLLSIYSELNEVERELRVCMDGIYDNSTVAEWLFTYIKPLKEELQTAIDARDRILTKDTWPKRPLFS